MVGCRVRDDTFPEIISISRSCMSFCRGYGKAWIAINVADDF